MKTLMTCIIVFWSVYIFRILEDYRKDCRKYGKENLAVPLKDRLAAFVICFVIPVIVGLLMSEAE